LTALRVSATKHRSLFREEAKQPLTLEGLFMARKPSTTGSKSKTGGPAPLAPEAQARVAAAAAAAAAPRPTVPKPAPKPAPAAPVTRRVEFVMDSPFASQVNLSGDFNGWEMTTLALRKDADGLWRITVELKPGLYAYKFLVDGQWVNDPNNPRTAANQFGSLNNVIEVA
jgi:hypothetical protein